MNKQDLIDAIAKQADISKVAAAKEAALKKAVESKEKGTTEN